MEVKRNAWEINGFIAHKGSINCLSIQPTPLNEEMSDLYNLYPTISTMSKDSTLKIWKNNSEMEQSSKQNKALSYY